MESLSSATVATKSRGMRVTCEGARHPADEDNEGQGEDDVHVSD